MEVKAKKKKKKRKEILSAAFKSGTKQRKDIKVLEDHAKLNYANSLYK